MNATRLYRDSHDGKYYTLSNHTLRSVFSGNRRQVTMNRVSHASALRMGLVLVANNFKVKA